MDSKLLQALDSDKRRELEGVRQAAGHIWSRPLHRYYTDHTVAHSDRVIALLDGLTEGMMTTDKHLFLTEVFILLAAAYLHDIGMQNERFADGDLEVIRASHQEQTAEMIYAVFEDPANAFAIPLAKDPGLVEAIALIAKGHRKVNLNAAEYDPLPHGGETVRLRLLAALLCFADELDIDHRRVDLEQMKLMNLPPVSQLHWWKCHYVSGVSITDGYICVAYRFPLARFDYADLIVPLVETDIRQKLSDLEEIFWNNGVKVALAKAQTRRMRPVQPLPLEVEELARQEIAKEKIGAKVKSENGQKIEEAELASFRTLSELVTEKAGVLLRQMKRYLPLGLYNELSRDFSPKLAEKHLKALLKAVQTYCPVPILSEAQSYPNSVMGKWKEATLLFADISGFTAISKRLNVRGRAGAEEIANIVNRYFTEMVKILHRNGGMLIKFGGDALLGMFEGILQETARLAVQSALDMQRAMIRFRYEDTSVGQLELQMKIGIHTGQVFDVHVGTASQVEYWLTGENANLTASAADIAKKNMIVVSKATQQHLNRWIDTEPIPEHPDFFQVPITQVRKLQSKPVSRNWPIPKHISELIRRLNVLVPYLPVGLLPRLIRSPDRTRIEGEHRLAAVLFVNVVGFNELASALEFMPAPERDQILLETIQDYFKAIQSCVEQHGGTINKTDLYHNGDKLLAIFGAQKAHEDDVDQAAYAAIAMMEALKEVNQRLAGRRPSINVQLRQRIGISVGLVFSGNVGSEACQAYTVMGSEVNLAARLMSMTSWGQIWVSSHLFNWLYPFGKFEFAGNCSIKGFEEPVPVYRLDSMGSIYRPQPPFVDQYEAQTIIQERLSRLNQERDQGQIVLLTGEPGIGKSRLWHELRPLAESQGVQWLSGYCREHSPTYQLFADILRDYLQLEETDEPETQRRVLVREVERLFGSNYVDEKGPFLATVMGLPLTERWKERISYLKGDLDEPRKGSQFPDPFALEVLAFLEKLTEERPLVLVCEDLHWLDEATAGILIKVFELVEYTPVILGLTSCPTPTKSAFYEEAASRYKPWLTEIFLEPLDAKDSARIVSEISGQVISPEQQEHIYKLSDGNPFYIIQISRMAVIAPDVQVPDTIYKIIESRVDTLCEEAKRTLKAAAIIGFQFSLSPLAFILEEEETDVSRHLAPLRRMHLIKIGKRGRYEFDHAITQEVIYRGQNLRDRRDQHLLLAEYWEKKGDASKAAHHYFVGEQWQKALEQSERVADQNLDRYANQEAIRLYKQALNAGEKLQDWAAQTRLHNKLGQVYLRIGDYEQAIHTHEKELGFWLLQSGEALAQAGVYSFLGHAYYGWGKLEKALARLNQGLELAGEGDSIERAKLLLRRCPVLSILGNFDAAERDGREAIKIAKGMGKKEMEARAWNHLGANDGRRGQKENGYNQDLAEQYFKSALQHHQNSLAIRRELNLEYDVAQSLLNIGTAFGFLGDPDKAVHYFREALEIKERVGDLRGTGIIHANLGVAYREQGSREDAEAELLYALEIREKIDDLKGVATVHHSLGELYLEWKRFDEAREHLKKSAQLYEKLGVGQRLFNNYMLLANAYLGSGRCEDALAAAQKAKDKARQDGNKAQEEAAIKLYEQIRQACEKNKE